VVGVATGGTTFILCFLKTDHLVQNLKVERDTDSIHQLLDLHVEFLICVVFPANV
jgi:hypothetical protein